MLAQEILDMGFFIPNRAYLTNLHLRN